MLTEQLLNWQTKVSDGLLTGSINTSCLCLWPQIYSRTVRGQSSIMQHRSAGEKPVGKFAKTASPWSHLSLRNLLCCSLYLPFLHLSHCTVPCLSLLSIILSPFWLAHSQPRPALSHYTLSMPLSCSTFPTSFISFICSVFLSRSDSHSRRSLLISAGRHANAQNEVLWPLLWHSKQSVDINHLMPLPLWNMFCYQVVTSAASTSLSPKHISLSPVFHCRGGRSTMSIMWNTATQYDAAFNLWTKSLLRGAFRF